MSIVRAAQRRTSTTPNATMTTLCSPSLGGAGLSLWHTAMAPGASGPWHRMDGEQVLTVLAGSVELDRDGHPSVRLAADDTVVLPADLLRRVRADDRAGAEMVCASAGPLRAVDGEGNDRGVPEWVA